MLDQDTDETLDGTEYYTMNHDRAMFLAICSLILQLKSLWELEVKLNGTALPGSANGIYQMEVDLWSIECAIAFINHIVKTKSIQSAS